MDFRFPIWGLLCRTPGMRYGKPQEWWPPPSA
jgi:hypothetical protein